MMDNKHLIKGLQQNNIEHYIIDKTVQIKKAVEELGWTFYSYDAMGDKFYVTIEIDREDEGPEYDGAGFTEEDRIVDGQYMVIDGEENTHHCDSLSCNCEVNRQHLMGR